MCVTHGDQPLVIVRFLTWGRLLGWFNLYFPWVCTQRQEVVGLGGTHHAKFGLRSDSSSARDYRLVDSRRAAEGEAGKGLVETMEEKRVRLECLAPPYSPGKCGYQCVIFSRRGSYFVESVDRKNRTSQRHPPARTLLSSTTLPAQCITPWLM